MALKTAEVNKARIQRIEECLGTSGDDELPVNTVLDSIQLISNRLNEMNGMLQTLGEKARDSPTGKPGKGYGGRC